MPAAPVRVHACATFPYDQTSTLHDLARAFRDGDEAAFERVATLVGEMLRAGWPTADLAAAPAVGVAAPGHRAGAVNEPCERLIVRLAEDVAWLRPAPGVLARIADAPEARTAAGRDVVTESGTLRWTLAGLPEAGPVLLLDDVVRTGSTLAAAIAAAPPELAVRIVPVAVFRAVPDPGAGGWSAG